MSAPARPSEGGASVPPGGPRAAEGAAGGRLQAVLQAVSVQGRAALIPFITAGDPHAEGTPEVMHALAEGGADIIELGVPFSDPMADGPVIQKAGERALARGIGLAQVLAMVSAFRERDAHTPVVLMGYANPLERYDQRHGPNAFVKAAQAAGVDGVLVVDYPPEECAAFAAALTAHGMDPIFLLAPTSTDERIRAVGELASGYVYYVSLKGVTGSANLDTAEVARAMPRIRAHVRVPVGVGFGIRDGATAQAVGRVADAVVIGSRLVQLLQDKTRDNAPRMARDFMAEIRQALAAR